MSLAAEAAEGALSSYLANEQRKGANQVDLENEKSMLDFNTLNQHQKPLDRGSHLLSGLLSFYAAHPETYGKNFDPNFLGDLGHAGVTREDMTYAKAPLLKPGGSGGGTSKGKSLLSGLLKGAAGALGNKGAAQNDAAGRAANAAGGDGYGGQSGHFADWDGSTQAGGFDNPNLGRGQFLQEDGSYGDTQDFSGSGNDDYDFYSQNENLFNGNQGGSQEQMQQGPQDADYDYDGDYSD